ncbi:MAG: formylglycine-generating enzyme family protein [Bryobacterales bacterium]|nr:formylglycine-generating enzyme family protein [Bryobacterales bacterium]
MKPEFQLFAGLGRPHPCCVPSRDRAEVLAQSRSASEQRPIIRSGSTVDMVKLDGERFFMGTEDKEGFPADGEGPVREVTLAPFLIDKYPVTNQQFSEFVQAAGYRSEAEAFGWSFVFQGHIPRERYQQLVDRTAPGIRWWCKVLGACWKHPEGPDSSIATRLHHPVVHMSWNDAAAYAAWSGKRLPTEAEWEYAARGGLEQKTFPWGDELTPGGRHLCNIWQGEFPIIDLAEDGYSAPCPVDAFPPNGYGLYTITGNAWEWCNDWFDPAYHITATRANPVGPPSGSRRLMKGGSYLCHRSYCNRYRVAARTSNTPDSATTNISFRCVRDV